MKLMKYLFLLSIVLLYAEDIDHASISVYAIHTNTGKVLVDKNSDLSLIPASTMKLVTTAAALHILGSEARFETTLEYDGVLDQKGTLHGNLYIRGGGDPCLGSHSWKQQLEVWSEAIHKLGIKKIEGKVIGDASRWETALAVPSWSWEDLGNYYGAGASALSFHENCYSLVFSPGKKVGDDATILRTDPFLPSLIFQNEVKTGPVGSGDRACIYGSEFSFLQYIRGTIPAAVQEFAIRGAIPDPAKYTADLLAKELGLPIAEKNFAPSMRTIIHTTYSPTIKEIVHHTNQKSINLYAEHLLKRMGEVVYHEGSTDAGVKAVTAFWKAQNIDLEGFNMVDGSGLSRKNLITTKQFVKMLAFVKKSTFYPIFFESLPQIEGKMRAKTGSMSLIRSRVGYSDDVAFAIIVNNCPVTSMMNEKIEQLLNQINKEAK